jgi:hypothetical protein
MSILEPVRTIGTPLRSEDGLPAGIAHNHKGRFNKAVETEIH